MSKKHIPPRKIRATYRDQGLQIYKGNPFIEALPEVLSDEEAALLMQNLPKMDEESRLYPNEKRAHLIYDVVQFFQPLDVHLDLQRRLSITIRAGYRGRNPTSIDYFQMIEEINDTLESASEKAEECGDEEVNEHKPRPTATGFYMVGFSGVGKTRAIDSILELYPQVIIHSEYNGSPLSRIQIVWLKLTCPHDGSLRGLCLDFMMSIDDLIGTNYYGAYKSEKNTTDILLGAMRRLAHIHGIGLLVIDEMQQLVVARGLGDVKMLNFFVDLVNRAGMPIVLIGTPKALRVLDKEFQQARRASGMGDKKWFPMKNDEEWTFMMETLFQYQYIRNPVQFDKNSNESKEISDTLWYVSAGIMDFAIKGFILAQFRAMDTGDEKITPDVIRAVAEEYFSFANNYIERIRGHRYESLSDIPDVDLFDLEEFYESYIGKKAAREENASKSDTASRSQDASHIKKSQAGVDTPSEGKGKTTTVKKPRKSRRSVDLKKAIAELPEGDMRRILFEALEKGQIPSEALKNSGYIHPAA